MCLYIQKTIILLRAFIGIYNFFNLQNFHSLKGYHIQLSEDNEFPLKQGKRPDGVSVNANCKMLLRLKQKIFVTYIIS